MGVNIRKKGAAAELEFCHRFQPFFHNTLERNLLQTREGGSDVSGSHPFVIEIKRVEDTGNGNKNSWWKQVLAAVNDPDAEIPCVAFRPSRQPWKFLIPASLIGIESKEFMEVSEDVWLQLVFKKFSEEPAPF